MIQIQKNTYEAPTEIREEVVQAICDAFLRKCAWSTFRPQTVSLYRRATLLVIGHENGEWYGFNDHPFSEREKSFRIRGVEMKAAFKELRKAGYHIFRVSMSGRNPWPGYVVSGKPYMDNGTEVFEFTDFID